MTIKKLIPRTRVIRHLRRLRRLRAGAALGIGSVFGFLVATFTVSGRGPRDWQPVLVIITAIYVFLTYNLLRTSVRQAEAAELNAKLLRNQLEDEKHRRAGPIALMVREIQSSLREWDRAARNGVAQELPQLFPPDFEQTLNLSATVDLYYHQELTSVQKALARASDKMEEIRSTMSPSPESEFKNVQTHCCPRTPRAGGESGLVASCSPELTHEHSPLSAPSSSATPKARWDSVRQQHAIEPLLNQ